MTRILRLWSLTLLLALLAAACGGGTADDPAATDAPADDAAGTDAPVDGADATTEREPTDGAEATAGAEPTAGATDDAAAAPTEAADGEPVTVGIITSVSGPLSAYGEDYVAGLEAGLDYATDGTGAAGGRPVELEIIDDAGDPEQAITAATDLIGRGVTIIGGSASSGVAVQMAPFAEENDVLFISGAAASDAISGINDHTFRAGRQTYQDVATAASLLEGGAGNVLVFAQDTEFGAGNVAAVEAVLGAEGATVDSLLVPMATTEFTPFAQQVAQAAPDLLFVAWAGETAPAMWQALEQQGVPELTTVTTGLAEEAVWPVYATGVEFLSHYFPGATDNEVNTALLEAVPDADLFTPDGWVTAQMIVRALEEAEPDDVDGMIAALEGWTFDAPKGEQTIREGDHAMLQPMFTASLEGEGDALEAQLGQTLEPDVVAPPEPAS